MKKKKIKMKLKKIRNKLSKTRSRLEAVTRELESIQNGMARDPGDTNVITGGSSPGNGDAQHVSPGAHQ